MTYTLPKDIFSIYCDDKAAGDFHTAQQNYYAGFAAGAATRTVDEKENASAIIKAFAAGAASRDAAYTELEQDYSAKCNELELVYETKDAEIEALRADAARYRFLRNPKTFGPAAGENLDKHIDAAMKGDTP